MPGQQKFKHAYSSLFRKTNRQSRQHANRPIFQLVGGTAMVMFTLAITFANGK